MGDINILSLTSDLVRIPSISRDAVACRQIIQKTQSLLQTQQVTTKVVSAAKTPILVWGELELSQTKWLINSHLDVVPASPTQFAPYTMKGKLWGRGAADTKGSCAVLLRNASKWKQFAKKNQLTFMLHVDEEIGGPSTKEILPLMPDLQGAIFLEPTGEKMVVAAKGIIQLQITAQGKSCHGSRSWEGLNALESLTNNLTTFRINHPQTIRETRHTTFNFSLLTAGSAINQVPDSATLWCDIRWNPSDNPEQIIHDLTCEFNHCKVKTLKLESPINCPQNSSLRQTFVNTLKRNSLNPLPCFEHGSSDARHCTALGIPALVFGPKGRNPHAEKEWVSIRSLEKLSLVLDHWLSHLST